VSSSAQTTVDPRIGLGDPDCPVCGGMGYVRYEVPITDPGFGKMHHCPVCGQRIIEAVRAKVFESQRERIARFSVARPEQTFETFDASGVRPMIYQAYCAALQYAAEPRGWLVLHGSYGTGKSHLASAIANKLSAGQVMSLVVPDLLELLRSGFDTGDYQELLDLTRQVRLLILDDMGTESSTPWACEKLFQIVNHRYNSVMPTVFVFNGVVEDMAPRIASRLKDTAVSKLLPMWGDDYRERKR